MKNLGATLRYSAAIALLASMLHAHSQIVRAEEPPSELTFDVTELGRTNPAGPGVNFGEYVYRGPDEFRVFGGNGFVRYGKLRTGFAYPVAGAIYRVSSANNRRVKFVKVAEEELPQTMKLRAGSYALPLLGKGKLHPWEFKVDGIARVDGEPRVSILGFFPGHSMSGTYRVGDSINVNGSLHDILSIVPSQDKFVGWIELDVRARKGPIPQKNYLEVYARDGRLEIPLVPSPAVRGNKSTVAYRDVRSKQEVVDFLVEHKGFAVAVPFSRKVYRVIQADGKRITCERVPDDGLPPGSVPDPDNFLVPVALRMTLDEWDCRVTKISTIGATHTAEIEGVGEAAGKFGTYKVGDEIVSNGTPHRVLNIVPSNEAKKMIGWVEVTPSPVPNERSSKNAKGQAM